MLKKYLDKDYKEVNRDGMYITNLEQKTLDDARDELSEGRAVTRLISWKGHAGLKPYLQLHYGVVTKSDGTDLLVKFDKGVRYLNPRSFTPTWVDVTIRRLNESEALEASTWLKPKLPKYNMLGIEPPFETV